MTEKVSKEFRIEKEDAAELLRDIADSLEEGHVNLDGDNWKLSQPVNEKVPVRVFKDKEGLEIGFKLLE